MSAGVKPILPRPNRPSLRLDSRFIEQHSPSYKLWLVKESLLLQKTHGAVAFRPIPALLCLSFFVSINANITASATPGRVTRNRPQQEVTRVLDVGKPVERVLKGGEMHVYQVTAVAGQYLHAVVEQRGIDVLVTLYASDGKKMLEVDSPNGEQGPEPVEVITEVSGAYRLEVRALEAKVPEGAYRVTLMSLRAATREDRRRMAEEAELAEATKLQNDANELLHNGRYDDALPLYLRSLAIREKTLGPDHPEVADALNNLAALYKAKGEYAQAEPLYERALAISEKALGPEHPDTAISLSNLAGLYRVKGEYVRAEPLFRRALAIDEKALGPEHPDTATSLNNLAGLYRAKGEYVRAEPLYERALRIKEKALGPEHPDVATSLNNLALLYHTKGDYERASPLYERALAIREKALGPEHPVVAATLNNLAGLYETTGDYTKAEVLYRRALAIDEKALGSEHPDVANALNNLAALYDATRNYERAEPLYERALAIREKALGPEHPDVSVTLGNLGGLYRAKGDYVSSEAAYRRALAIDEKVLGPEHPDIATTLNNLSALYETMGDHARAVQFQSRGNEVQERTLSLILSTGSERQKLAYLATLSGNTDATISLHARSAPSDPQALELALTTVLRRKGRALDAMSDQVASLRKRLDPQDRDLLDGLSAAQSRLSRLVLGGAGQTPPAEHKADISRLEAEVERLQDAVSRRSAAYRVQTRPVTVEHVRRALPAGAALAEFFAYQPFDVKTRGAESGAPRYIAYVLHKEREPLWADLGEALSLDADIARLLVALKCPQTGKGIRGCPSDIEVKRLARAVEERVMRPVRKLLGDTRQVFVSPDGSLNLVPFAALVDENDKYLVESYSLTYLTSGRDLLRLQIGSESRQPPLVVADPAFGEAAGSLPATNAVTTPTPSGRDEKAESKRSGEMARMQFAPLRGTAEEAKALGPMLKGVRVLTRGEATETALKDVSAPRVLHIATHGFFLSDRPQETAPADGRGIELGGGGATAAESQARIENPLLRSGLALEGANNRRGAKGEDGILTALEVAGTDLWGTKLVVLSACETGVGEVKNGEGVYGLRRALVLAGSESQVMSLWQVSDDATRDLMVAYYKRLIAGEGRSEALRQVQLDMLRGGKVAGSGARRGLVGVQAVAGKANYSHPFYWAAFIQSGEWRDMNYRAPNK